MLLRRRLAHALAAAATLGAVAGGALPAQAASGAPTVAITSPLAGTTVGRTVTVTLSVSPNNYDAVLINLSAGAEMRTLTVQKSACPTTCAPSQTFDLATWDNASADGPVLLQANFWGELADGTSSLSGSQVVSVTHTGAPTQLSLASFTAAPTKNTAFYPANVADTAATFTTTSSATPLPEESLELRLFTDDLSRTRVATATGTRTGTSGTVTLQAAALPEGRYLAQVRPTTPTLGYGQGFEFALIVVHHELAVVTATPTIAPTNTNTLLTATVRGPLAMDQAPGSLVITVDGGAPLTLTGVTWSTGNLGSVSGVKTAKAPIPTALPKGDHTIVASVLDVNGRALGGPTTTMVTLADAPDPTGALNAKVRGDWTGEGRVDVLGRTLTGRVYWYPGTGGGKVSSGKLMPIDFSGYNYLGSPGDLTGEGRTDLIARDTGGGMWRFNGLGNGALTAPVKVGAGFGSFHLIATPGDLNGDKRGDLLVTTAAGTMLSYQFTTAGTMASIRQVGTGWGSLKYLIGMGDLNGDGRGDIVSVSSTDGCLYQSLTAADGTIPTRARVGCGWAPMTTITSAGDMDGDKLGDLLARRSDGVLFFYRGKPGGGVYSGIQVGVNWNGMAQIL